MAGQFGGDRTGRHCLGRSKVAEAQLKGSRSTTERQQQHNRKAVPYTPCCPQAEPAESEEAKAKRVRHRLRRLPCQREMIHPVYAYLPARHLFGCALAFALCFECPSRLRENRLCLKFPLLLRLRQCLCLVFPLTFARRHCLCLVFPLPSF